MDETLKMLLEQINDTIKELRNDYTLSNEKINIKLDSKISDIRKTLEEIQIKLEKFQNIFITNQKCDEKMGKIESGKEELSLKKLTLIITCVSGAMTAITTTIIEIVKMMTK